MTKLSIAALAAAFVVVGAPAYAKTDCDGGFKSHLGKMTTYVDTTPGPELANAIRRSLDAYDSCKAGDSFSPHGVWDQVLAEMAQSGK